MYVRPSSYSLKHPKASLVQVTRTRNESVGVVQYDEKFIFDGKTLSTNVEDRIGSSEVIWNMDRNIISHYIFYQNRTLIY